MFGNIWSLKLPRKEIYKSHICKQTIFEETSFFQDLHILFIYTFFPITCIPFGVPNEVMQFSSDWVIISCMRLSQTEQILTQRAYLWSIVLKDWWWVGFVEKSKKWWGFVHKIKWVCLSFIKVRKMENRSYFWNQCCTILYKG